jgi:uncharacterized surface protein with fasciclin (FAS1) repeats
MFQRIVRSLAVVIALALVMVSASPAAAKSSEPTIVGVALAVNGQTGEFSTLIAALQAADLVDALNGKGQFTVFAPTDAAFAKLGLNAGNIGSLPKGDLTNILLYHVARGERVAADVVSASRIRMLNKGFVKVSVGPEGAFVNSSKIIATDVQASNGVIHIIDTVLLP